MKECDLLVFGVPRGFSCSECDDKTRNFLMSFYVPHKPGTIFKSIRRADNSVWYVFLVYENPDSVFLDAHDRIGSFFGMTLYIYDEYFTNPEKLKMLFQDIYDKYVKNTIIEELPNGLRRHKFSAFNMPGDKIKKYVLNAFRELIKTNPEFANLSKEIKPLPPINQNKMQRN